MGGATQANAGLYKNDAAIKKTEAANQWAFFQAKSTKQSLSEFARDRSEEHTSELQSPCNLVCRLLLEKKKKHRLTSVSSDSATVPLIPSSCRTMLTGSVK